MMALTTIGMMTTDGGAMTSPGGQMAGQAEQRGAEILGYDMDGEAIEHCSICDELIDWADNNSFELEYYQGECIPAHVACIIDSAPGS